MRELDRTTSKDLTPFIEREIMFLTRLEDVYIAARYLPRKYEKKKVEELLKFAERLKEELKDV